MDTEMQYIVKILQNFEGIDSFKPSEKIIIFFL